MAEISAHELSSFLDISGEVEVVSTALSTPVPPQHEAPLRTSTPLKAPTKGFLCSECGCVLKTSNGLKAHKALKHQTSPPTYKCNICEKSFIKKINFESHLNFKHLNIKPFSCGTCKAKYASRDSLTRHTKAGCTSGDGKEKARRHQCPMCSKHFKRKDSLRLHVNAKHHNLLQYRCEVCAQPFTYRSTLKRHRDAKECRIDSQVLQ